jgi:acyl carrier protein
MDYKNALMEYIRDEIVRNRGAVIKEDEDLLSSGVIDSLSILKLVSFVEERFGIQVPDEDVVYDNFKSISALTEYLQQHGQ